jgi:hypothetical protein
MKENSKQPLVDMAFEGDVRGLIQHQVSLSLDVSVTS